MRLTVLGSGNFIPTIKRAHPAFWLEAANKNILIDIGPGTVRQIVKAGLDFRKIDILIIISHLHVDHINDLFSLTQLYNSQLGYAGIKKLTIIAGFGFKRFFKEISKIYEDAKPKPGKLNIKIYELKTYQHPDFIIETVPGKHSPSSIMIKIREKNGKELIYTGDTAYNEEISKFSSQPELLITECMAFNKELKANHMTVSQAAKTASLISAKRLLLIHLAPENNPSDIIWEVPKYYHGRLIIAEDFLKVQF